MSYAGDADLVSQSRGSLRKMIEVIVKVCGRLRWPCQKPRRGSCVFTERGYANGGIRRPLCRPSILRQTQLFCTHFGGNHHGHTRHLCGDRATTIQSVELPP